VAHDPLQRSISVSLWAAVVALCAACAGGRATQAASVPVDVADARPAAGPFEAPPGIEHQVGEPEPEPAALGRDGHAVGRLTAEGQRARFPFECAAGELALFEVTAYGYARGWDAALRLTVRDAAGAVLAQRERAGAALFSDFLAFQAPAAGHYELELGAARHYFRYLVVRHAGYRARGPEAAAAVPADQASAHGFTAGAGSAQRFQVRARPGSVLTLRAEPTTERGWKQKRALRAAAPAVAAGLAARPVSDPRRNQGRDQGRELSRDPGGHDDLSFPDLEVRAVDSAGRPLASAPVGLSVTVPADGVVLVTVAQTDAGPGGLFTLALEREVERVPCVLRVGDRDDEPLVGVRVALLAEPALERVALVETDLDGTVKLQLPAGPYTAVLQPRGGAPVVVRTRLGKDAELNFVLGR